MLIIDGANLLSTIEQMELRPNIGNWNRPLIGRVRIYYFKESVLWLSGWLQLEVYPCIRCKNKKIQGGDLKKSNRHPQARDRFDLYVK